jgi:hypothetical protein
LSTIITGIVAKQGKDKQKKIDHEITELKGKIDQETEILKGNISKENSEAQALLDYRSEALKNLYKECEPLIFQSITLSKNALVAISDLSKNTSNGGKEKLDMRSEFMKITIYRLFAPLAAYKILQSKITLVDLNLDENKKLQFEIGQYIYNSFTEDLEIAKTQPALTYDPYMTGDAESERERKEKESPSIHKLQGIKIITIEQVIHKYFIQQTDEKIIGVNPMAIFISKAFPTDGNNQGFPQPDIQGIIELFEKFHPMRKPVLWRTLIIQAYLYEALIWSSDTNKTNAEIRIPSKYAEYLRTLFDKLKVSVEQLELFDWRSPHDNISYEDAIVRFFTAAENYLKRVINYFPEYDPVIEPEVAEYFRKKYVTDDKPLSIDKEKQNKSAV